MKRSEFKLQIICSKQNILSISGCLVFIFLTTFQLAYAAPGDLDITFGNGGKVVTPIGGGNASDSSNDLAVQSDGKIMVVGATNAGTATSDFAVVRYNTDGSLDTSFGNAGKVITSISTKADEALAVLIQPDGKILVGGRSDLNDFGISQFALVRYMPNGTLDNTFGTAGITLTPFGTSDDARANDMILLADGKIVLTGRVAGSPGGFAAARYNSNGSLDTTFGISGKFTSNTSNAFPSSSASQSDGKILIAGYTAAPNDDNFAVFRINANGTADTTFGTNGIATVSLGEHDHAYDVAVQPDGKIVLVGSVSGSIFDSAGIVRFNPNGSLDTSFDSDGKAIISGSDARAVIIQPDSKILTVGYGADPNGNFAFGLIRCNPSGSPDTSFGTGGKVITVFSPNTQAQPKAAILQNDGKIVAAGSLFDGTQSDFAVARYLNDAFVTHHAVFDFDGDNKTDYGVFRPSTSTWYLQNSQTGFSAVQFGISSDKLVPADYDGDGKADIAVYRNGTWYLLRSSLGLGIFSFGNSSDIPVPADFDRDGKAELAIYRPSDGNWWRQNLATNQVQVTTFGISEDKPVPADFDGDSKTDLAVFRPSNGTWYMLRSSQGFTAIPFGVSTDKPVVGDYDGDGKADQAVFRDGTWYVLGSTSGVVITQFGLSADKPVAGDYDGDGKTDIAVWRASNGIFYLLRSGSGNQFSAQQFGSSGDLPVANSYIP